MSEDDTDGLDLEAITTRPHRLARVVRPYPGEVLLCYLRRLAHANALGLFRSRPEMYLAPPDPEPDSVVAHLVALTGLSPTTFERGLYWPDDNRYRTRYACTRCTTRKSIFETVTIGAVHGISVCLSHLRWLGYPNGHPQERSVATFPELIAAGHRHHNLLRRHGRQRVTEAEKLAIECIVTWTQFRSKIQLRGAYDLHDRMRADGWDDFDAATYPNVIALTALIASPYWLDLARTPAGIERIVGRIANDVTRQRPLGSDDPFLAWMYRQQHSRYKASDILTVPPPETSSRQ